jgi:C4-dicarboxylate transporter, DctM subunit
LAPEGRDGHLHKHSQGIDDAHVHYRHFAPVLLRDELPAYQPVEWIVAMHLSKWVLLTAILVFVIVLGFFLPPVSIILMTAPIILPPLKLAGFGLVWFGVVMTIVMEMGLIHPPVGLNIFVIKNIAPDIPLGSVIMGVLPLIVLMTFAAILLCFFPDLIMGVSTK